MEFFFIRILLCAGHQTFAYITTAYRICLCNSLYRVFIAISVVASLAAFVVGIGVLAATISYIADIGAA